MYFAVRAGSREKSSEKLRLKTCESGSMERTGARAARREGSAEPGTEMKTQRPKHLIMTCVGR